MSEVLQFQRRPQTPFHRAVILLDDMLRYWHERTVATLSLRFSGPKLTNGPMGSLVSVEGDRPDRSPEARLCLPTFARAPLNATEPTLPYVHDFQERSAPI